MPNKLLEETMTHASTRILEVARWQQDSVVRASKALALAAKRVEEGKTQLQNLEKGETKKRVEAILAKLGELGVTDLKVDAKYSWRLELAGQKVLGGEPKPVRGSFRFTARGVSLEMTASIPHPDRSWPTEVPLYTLRYYKNLTVANRELDLALGD